MASQNSCALLHAVRGALIFFALISMVIQTGCARQGRSKSIVTECILPNGTQDNTISGRWPVTPIPTAYAQGQFNTAEINSMISATNSWNEFYEKSRGFPLLDHGDGVTSTAAKPSVICSQGLITNNAFSGQVVIYKQGVWPYDPNIVALTSFCPIPDTPYPRIFMALMEINYENFFVQGKRLPDLESIYLHELGHLVGLNHSCENTTLTGVPNCGDDGLDPDFFFAVMFPVILFPNGVSGEVRRDLRDNDMGRANCLYDDLTSSGS